MNPLSRIRLWWHQPVLDRLDAIERNTRPRAVSVEKPDQQTARDFHEMMSGRGSWRPYPSARRPS